MANEISDISPLVDNTGLGRGDKINLRFNPLDLTPDSQAMNDIQTLLDRGVEVSYGTQNKDTAHLMPLIGGIIIIVGVVVMGLVIFFVRRERTA